ncbi:hypothetical protein BESB_057080 [Besnoitia besnoiti]|uniref:Uncharacterized protein n=1 Tax=Besnoitia besnoiti TaxID=94643 RepID=A0A2A9MKB8_BESBE|nr:hypothetical protein BESB_057080 [Besnoitia besnoiti]PFH36057.1 hypothetical protein BESB_057080 [Besnoitia besnoiti]
MALSYCASPRAEDAYIAQRPAADVKRNARSRLGPSSAGTLSDRRLLHLNSRRRNVRCGLGSSSFSRSRRGSWTPPRFSSSAGLVPDDDKPVDDKDDFFLSVLPFFLQNLVSSFLISPNFSSPPADVAVSSPHASNTAAPAPPTPPAKAAPSSSSCPSPLHFVSLLSVNASSSALPAYAPSPAATSLQPAASAAAEPEASGDGKTGESSFRAVAQRRGDYEEAYDAFVAVAQRVVRSFFLRPSHSSSAGEDQLPVEGTRLAAKTAFYGLLTAACSAAYTAAARAAEAGERLSDLAGYYSSSHPSFSSPFSSSFSSSGSSSLSASSSAVSFSSDLSAACAAALSSFATAVRSLRGDEEGEYSEEGDDGFFTSLSQLIELGAGNSLCPRRAPRGTRVRVAPRLCQPLPADGDAEDRSSPSPPPRRRRRVEVSSLFGADSDGAAPLPGSEAWFSSDFEEARELESVCSRWSSCVSLLPSGSPDFAGFSGGDELGRRGKRRRQTRGASSPATAGSQSSASSPRESDNEDEAACARAREQRATSVRKHSAFNYDPRQFAQEAAERLAAVAAAIFLQLRGGDPERDAPVAGGRSASSEADRGVLRDCESGEPREAGGAPKLSRGDRRHAPSPSEPTGAASPSAASSHRATRLLSRTSSASAVRSECACAVAEAAVAPDRLFRTLPLHAQFLNQATNLSPRLPSSPHRPAESPRSLSLPSSSEAFPCAAGWTFCASAPASARKERKAAAVLPPSPRSAVAAPPPADDDAPTAGRRVTAARRPLSPRQDSDFPSVASVAEAGKGRRRSHSGGREAPKRRRDSDASPSRRVARQEQDSSEDDEGVFLASRTSSGVALPASPRPDRSFFSGLLARAFSLKKDLLYGGEKCRRTRFPSSASSSEACALPGETSRSPGGFPQALPSRIPFSLGGAPAPTPAHEDAREACADSARIGGGRRLSLSGRQPFPPFSLLPQARASPLGARGRLQVVAAESEARTESAEALLREAGSPRVGEGRGGGGRTRAAEGGERAREAFATHDRAEEEDHFSGYGAYLAWHEDKWQETVFDQVEVADVDIDPLERVGCVVM